MNLPQQQLKCLWYLSTGMTIKEIGKIMDLSPRTVEFYIKIIKEKTGKSRRSELVHWFFLHQERMQRSYEEMPLCI